MRRWGRLLGVAILCFGFGILVAFFLPFSVLIVIEAVVIILAGILFLKCW